MNLLELLTSPWALQPQMLHEMLGVYATHLRGDKIDIAAIEARLQRPLANDQQEYTLREGGIAVLPVEGVLAPKANLFTRVSGGASAQMLTRQAESAIADPRVRALVLAIDSPGGSVFGSPEFAQAVFELSQTKPIVAVSDGLLASAAYWIGSAANAVYISGPTVNVGSIGVVATHAYNPRSAEGLTEITAGRYKRIASENAPLTEEGRAHMQARVDHLYGVFIEAVAKHRGTDAATVIEHMADGRVFIGQQAIDAGLVDGVATVDQIVEQLAANPQAFAARRSARIKALGVGPAPAAQAAAGDAANGQTKPTHRKATMPITREQLQAEAPELLKAIMQDGDAAGHARGKADGYAEGVKAGDAQAVERIKAIHGLTSPGHEALIQGFMFDGHTSAGEAALQLVAAQRKVLGDKAQALASDAPAPLPQVPSNPVRGPAPAGEAAAPAAPAGYSVNADRARLHADALAHQASNPGVTYLDAIKAVQKGA